jgi:SSS family solute:Na+ symporter
MTVMFWPVVIFMAISLAIGVYTYTKVRGSSTNYTVCNKSLPFIVVGTTLLAQAVDGNATLGNVSLTYTSGIWTGLMIPVGLALSLFLVGRFLASPLNKMNLLTLPEFFYRRYGASTELLVSILTVVCFTVLIAGNLSAVAWVLSVVSGIKYLPALIITTAVIVTYTMAGGLYSAVWTDFFQIHVALVGFIASAVWVIYTRGWSLLTSVSPDKIDATGLINFQAGALPNWAGMVALFFGNAMALDFMERVFAAKSPSTARRGCYYAGLVTLIIGACATVLGIASITSMPNAADPRMVLPQMGVNILPYWMGMLVFIGVLGASMSTANGAMLVIAVVLARNVVQRHRKLEITDSKMLMLSRAFAIPTAAAAMLFAWVRPEPGILLVVAFDIVLAGCVVPLFAGVYWPKATARGAIASIVVGTTARIVAHFVTPSMWAGLDTLIPPVLSAMAFFALSSRQPVIVEDAASAEAL